MYSRKRPLLLLGLVCLVCACACERPGGSSSFVSAIERAHRAERWHKQQAFAAEIEVVFGGRQMLAGTMIFNPAVNRVRMELAGGEVLVYDGRSAYLAPAAADFARGRFHVLTWPYFLAAPFKLSDPGTRLTAGEDLVLEDATYPTARLSFDAGVGDTPDDWYHLFRDPHSDRLVAMGYIVTYGKSRTEAEKKPSIIVYRDYQAVEGIPISLRWDFYYWDPARGREEQPKGRVTIRDPRFVEPAPDAYEPPAGARELPPPE